MRVECGWIAIEAVTTGVRAGRPCSMTPTRSRQSVATEAECGSWSIVGRVDHLTALRGPGESYSDVIPRLAATVG